MFHFPVTFVFVFSCATPDRQNGAKNRSLGDNQSPGNGISLIILRWPWKRAKVAYYKPVFQSYSYVRCGWLCCRPQKYSRTKRERYEQKGSRGFDEVAVFLLGLYVQDRKLLCKSEKICFQSDMLKRLSKRFYFQPDYHFCANLLLFPVQLQLGFTKWKEPFRFNKVILFLLLL